MNLTKFRSKVAEIDKIIPRNRWIEIPIENNFWCFFEHKGLYAIYNKSEIIYIGITSNINSRLKEHISYEGKFRDQEKIFKIKIKISSLKQPLLEHIEKRFISRLKPKYNKQVISRRILEINREHLLSSQKLGIK